jgi:hypothetical protein
MAVGAGVSALGGWAVLVQYDLGTAPTTPRDPAAAWAFVQCLAGVWAGILGAGSPLLHGLVAGVPAFFLGATLGVTLPLHFDALGYFLAPASAVIAAAALRYFAARRKGLS